MDRFWLNEAKAAASIREFTAIAYYIGLYSKLQAIVQHNLIPRPLPRGQGYGTQILGDKQKICSCSMTSLVPRPSLDLPAFITGPGDKATLDTYLICRA